MKSVPRRRSRNKRRPIELAVDFLVASDAAGATAEEFVVLSKDVDGEFGETEYVAVSACSGD